MKFTLVRPRWQRLTAVLAGCCLAATLAACGADSKGLQAETAKQFQARVLTITEAAAGGDNAGALASLDALVVDLDAASSSGDVSFARHQSIKGAIDAVRVDLAAAQAAAQVPAPSSSPSEVPTPAVEAPAPALDSGNSGQVGIDRRSNDKGPATGKGKG